MSLLLKTAFHLCVLSELFILLMEIIHFVYFIKQKKKKAIREHYSEMTLKWNNTL